MARAQAHSDGTRGPTPAPAGLDEDAKRSFLRMISHELRTPLNSIIGSSGHKMLRLVNQIVEIVRLESQAADLDLRPEPLGALVEDVFDSLREEAAAVGVRLQAEGIEAMPWVRADARGLKTALANLLQNALAHAPAGDAVRVRALGADGRVRIEVEDGGPGADPAETPRLMRPFEQGEQALTRATDGAGLGLPIAQLLSRAMGGELSIRTARGQGFTAVVDLPAA